MVIPGYDPDQLDENLRERLAEWAITQLLTEAEQERLREGESLLTLMDEEDIDRIMEEDRPGDR
jgi:hypothetical protein